MAQPPLLREGGDFASQDNLDSSGHRPPLQGKRLVPDAGHSPRAFGAQTVHHAHLPNAISETFDKQVTTTRTVRVFRIAHRSWKVSGVNEIQTRGSSDLHSPNQSCDWSVVGIRHPIVLVEGGDMPGD